RVLFRSVPGVFLYYEPRRRHHGGDALPRRSPRRQRENGAPTLCSAQGSAEPPSFATISVRRLSYGAITAARSPSSVRDRGFQFHLSSGRTMTTTLQLLLALAGIHPAAVDFPPPIIAAPRPPPPPVA